MDMNKIKISDKQLSLIDKSLEAFARGRAGQFVILFEILFPDLDYEQKNELERLIKSKMDSFKLFGGWNYDKSENDLDVWDIHKLFDEYLSVKENGGWGETVNFTGPIDRNGMPEIEGFSEWREFIFPEEMQGEMNGLFKNRDFHNLREKAREIFNVKYSSASEIFMKKSEENLLTTTSKDSLVGVKYKKPIFNK